MTPFRQCRLLIAAIMDKSEEDISSFFGDLSRNLEGVCSWLWSSSSADHSPSTSFHGARNALQSLRSADATVSLNMSSSFSRSSNPPSGTEPRRNSTLASVARGPGSSQNWSSWRQSTFPYGRWSLWSCIIIIFFLILAWLCGLGKSLQFFYKSIVSQFQEGNWSQEKAN